MQQTPTDTISSTVVKELWICCSHFPSSWDRSEDQEQGKEERQFPLT